jgi:hypothetical protein
LLGELGQLGRMRRCHVVVAGRAIAQPCP